MRNFGGLSYALAVSACSGTGAPTTPAQPPAASLVAVSGGTFIMGDPDGDDNEAPAEVTVGPFRIMRHEVTNTQFWAFVSATGHVTDPERRGHGSVWIERKWRRIDGADWRHPHGPSTSIRDRDTHAVVQVSRNDAEAYCAHYGLRLPTEEEWELAARGTEGRRYAWGNDPPRDGAGRRGNFGTLACCAADDSDGYEKVAPVGQFPEGASPYGLYDMTGNVWEWTSSPFPGRPDRVSLRGGGWGNSAYCLRASYRHMNPPDIGLGMVGFRCAADPVSR
jgi:formylglycine-generating enzyme required for sulfatase activity